MASNLFASPRCLHAQVLMAMNMFTATHTCVMVYINDHRLYCILASLYLSIGICALHSFLVLALLSKQLFRDFPVIMQAVIC